MIKPSVMVRAEPYLTFTVKKSVFEWLKVVMQNPIYDDETEEEAEFRIEFLTAMIKVDVSGFHQAAYDLDEIPF